MKNIVKSSSFIFLWVISFHGKTVMWERIFVFLPLLQWFLTKCHHYKQNWWNISHLVDCENRCIGNFGILFFGDLFLSVEEQKWFECRWCIHFAIEWHSPINETRWDAFDFCGFLLKFQNPNFPNLMRRLLFTNKHERDRLVEKWVDVGMIKFDLRTMMKILLIQH